MKAIAFLLFILLIAGCSTMPSNLASLSESQLNDCIRSKMHELGFFPGEGLLRYLPLVMAFMLLIMFFMLANIKLWIRGSAKTHRADYIIEIVMGLVLILAIIVSIFIYRLP